MISSKIGSVRAQQGGISLTGGEGSNLDPQVSSLIEYIFNEANNKLSQVVQGQLNAEGTIQTPLGTLSLPQIEKAQVILLQIGEILKEESPDTSKLQELSKEYYSSIPQEQKTDILDFKVYETQEELLQLLKDILNVGEVTGSSLYSNSMDVKYKSLGCQIELLEKDSNEFKEISKMLTDKRMEIKNIYSVIRPSERDVFTHSIGNQKILFHGSRTSNIVGILSRGLLTPKIVVSKGVKRTGMKVYFF